MLIAVNDLESSRFRIVAGRLQDPAADPEAINAAARSLSLDLLISRLPIDALDQLHRLEADGHRLMDTLVYYERSLSQPPEPSPPPPGLVLRGSTPEDAAAVAAIARDAFKGYIGHYHADPRLDRAAADAAYVEWAEASTRRPGPGHTVIAAQGDVPVGFLTLVPAGAAQGGGFGAGAREAEIVLNAVSPGLQGRGTYAAMLNAAQRYCAEAGVGRVTISTQINNFAVQRAWVRQGFAPFGACYTLHKWYS